MLVGVYTMTPVTRKQAVAVAVNKIVNDGSIPVCYRPSLLFFPQPASDIYEDEGYSDDLPGATNPELTQRLSVHHAYCGSGPLAGADRR